MILNADWEDNGSPVWLDPVTMQTEMEVLSD